MRVLILLLFTVMLGWSLALIAFVQSMPRTPTPPSVHTDAIVVLTGGNARVERGLDMLAQGAAPVLLVSGVGKHVTMQQMLTQHASAETRQTIHDRGASIVFDYIALTTQTNAREVAQFVRERGYHSIRLITAHYHMPRSIAEMQAVLPEVEIVPDPVFPSGFQSDQWWQHENSRKLVLSEFHKNLAVHFRPLIERLHS